MYTVCKVNLLYVAQVEKVQITHYKVQTFQENTKNEEETSCKEVI